MRQFFSHPSVAISLKIVVSFALLAGLLYYYIDVDTIIVSFKNANTVYVTIGLTLAFIQQFIHFYRWRYLLRLVSEKISNKEVFTSLYVGFMAGFFTPAQIGEFAGRIASHPSVNRSHIIGITVIDKLYWTALTFIIGGGGLTMFMAYFFTDYWNAWFLYVALIVILAITIVFLVPEKMKGLLTMLPDKVREHRFYEMIQVIDDKFHNNNARVLFSLTFFLYVFTLCEYYFLALAFGYVSFIDALICGASVFFVKAVILPISFGDLGIRESAAIFFFGKVGVSAAVAFNASIIMSFINVIVPTAIGAVLVLRLKKT